MNPPEPAAQPSYGSPFFNTLEGPDSPKPPSPGWRGLLIAGPSRAVLSLKQPMLLLRGTYRIQGDAYPKDDRLRLVAIDVRTRQEYSQTAGQRDASPDEPPPPAVPPDPAVTRRMVFSGHFNADLMGTLHLPWAPATYRVLARMGDLQSNELTVQVDIK
jgi:hypothetical protein